MSDELIKAVIDLTGEIRGLKELLAPELRQTETLKRAKEEHQDTLNHAKKAVDKFRATYGS